MKLNDNQMKRWSKAKDVNLLHCFQNFEETRRGRMP